MNTPRFALGAVAALVLAAGTLAAPAASAEVRTRSVQFAKGATSATVRGTVRGDDTVDHVVRAAAGQTMTVSLTANRPSVYFNVLPPGSKDEAIYNASSGGNRWSGTLQADGEHTVRVYLMRNEARRDRPASYVLTVGVTGAGAATAAARTPGSVDAKVPGTPFHATGEVPCTVGAGAPGSCPFGVVRRGAGRAEVRVTMPGGASRVLRFAGDRVTAPGSRSVRATRQGDEWSVEVVGRDGPERYRVVDAVVNGG